MCLVYKQDARAGTLLGFLMRLTQATPPYRLRAHFAKEVRRAAAAEMPWGYVPQAVCQFTRLETLTRSRWWTTRWRCRDGGRQDGDAEMEMVDDKMEILELGVWRMAYGVWRMATWLLSEMPWCYVPETFASSRS